MTSDDPGSEADMKSLVSRTGNNLLEMERNGAVFRSSFERLGRISAPPAAGRAVYLDYAGFSPVDPRVVAMMRPFLEGGVAIRTPSTPGA